MFSYFIQSIPVMSAGRLHSPTPVQTGSSPHLVHSHHSIIPSTCHNVFLSFQDSTCSFFLIYSFISAEHILQSIPSRGGGEEEREVTFWDLESLKNIFILTLSGVWTIFSSVIMDMVWLYFPYTLVLLLRCLMSFLFLIFYSFTIRKTSGFFWIGSLFLFWKFMMICHYMGFHYIRYLSWEDIFSRVIQNFLYTLL